MSSKEEPNVVRKKDDTPIIEDWVSDSEEENVSQTQTEKKIVKPSIAKIEFVKPNQQEKTARKTIKQVEKHRQNTHRDNKRNWNNMMSQRLGSTFEMFNKACYVCGSFDQDREVNTAWPKAVVNAVKGNNVNVVKASDCWVWKPKTKVLDHGNPQIDLQEQGVIDSGCPRHMTGNMSYLTDYEKIDRGYLIDESQVLLRVPRKNNMYSVDLKNIVPKRGLTYLYTKATSDESNLWHRRLGSGPDWLLDIDALTRTMNYEPIVAGTQSNGFAGTKVSDNADQAIKETEADDGSKPLSDGGKKVDEDSRKDSKYNDQEKEDNVNNFNNINVASINEVNAVGGKTSIELPFDLNMHALEDYSIFDSITDDEDDGAEANMNNLDTTILEELLQFMLKEVWTLVELPNGKRAIGTKWVFGNKKDERGIVIRNKARLVAQGYTQEERIDYDEVFTPVARTKAIRLKKHCMDCIKLPELGMKPLDNGFQRGKIDDIDADEVITLVDVTAENQGRFNDEEMFDAGVLDGEEVFASAEQEVAAVKEVPVDDVKKVVSIVEVTTTDSNGDKKCKTQVKGIVFRKPGESKTTTTPIPSKIQDKGKAKMIEPEPVKKLSKKDQLKHDEEITLKLQAEINEDERIARAEEEKIDEANIA
ncbi:ribonuclease H-like domain-containing protein [Tanacetum coccineum]